MYFGIKDLRREFKRLLAEEKFVTVYGKKTIEIAPAFFLADDDRIFGEPNADYVEREIRWYESMSLNVNDIPGGPPRIWKSVATPDGYVNSNYGWAVYSPENGSQYENVLSELRRDSQSRRGVVIYTRPTMHVDQKRGGMSDFMCTNTVQYFIRGGSLSCVVSMRSNDAVFGYRNDFAWQRHVLHKMAGELGVKVGDVWWCAGSLHFYEDHFHLVEDGLI